VSIARFAQEGEPCDKRWYYMGAGVSLWLTWQVGTAAGVFLGARVPASWSLDFAVPLTFIALAFPVIRDRTTGITAATAGLSALAADALPYHSGLMIGALCGVVAGFLLEERRRKWATK